MRVVVFIFLFQAGIQARTQHVDHLDVRSFQEEVIKTLTGMVSSQEVGILEERSTPSGRKKTAKIIEQYLLELGLKPRFHNYTAAHPMIFPDLFFGPARGTNVYAILETNPAYKYIVVGAHYDAEPGSPGAGDNASGVAVVLSLIEKLLVNKDRPFNYIFVLFDQEEDDEIGSRAFADFIDDEGFNVHSVHVTDLSGWDEDGDKVVLIQTTDESMIVAYSKASEKLGIEIQLIGGASSDNKSFQSQFSTVGVFGDITKHLHKPTDTYETVDFEFLNLMTQLMSEVLVTLDKKAL